jgi:hypothetical protein
MNKKGQQLAVNQYNMELLSSRVRICICAHLLLEGTCPCKLNNKGNRYVQARQKYSNSEKGLYHPLQSLFFNAII